MQEVEVVLMRFLKLVIGCGNQRTQEKNKQNENYGCSKTSELAFFWGNLQYILAYQPDVESFDVKATPFPGISFPSHNIAYKIL